MSLTATNFPRPIENGEVILHQKIKSSNSIIERIKQILFKILEAFSGIFCLKRKAMSPSSASKVQVPKKLSQEASPKDVTSAASVHSDDATELARKIKASAQSRVLQGDQALMHIEKKINQKAECSSKFLAISIVSGLIAELRQQDSLTQSNSRFYLSNILQMKNATNDRLIQAGLKLIQEIKSGNVTDFEEIIERGSSERCDIKEDLIATRNTLASPQRQVETEQKQAYLAVSRWMAALRMYPQEIRRLKKDLAVEKNKREIQAKEVQLELSEMQLNRAEFVLSSLANTSGIVSHDHLLALGLQLMQNIKAGKAEVDAVLAYDQEDKRLEEEESQDKQVASWSLYSFFGR